VKFVADAALTVIAAMATAIYASNADCVVFDAR
jgi:hypothetical protein